MPRQGELVLLVSPKGKRYLRPLTAGEALHTNDGYIQMEQLLEAEYGRTVDTHLGKPYRLLRPSLHDMLRGVKRQTQVIYPKEIGYICLRLGVGPGRRVIEAGSGSGALTLALSWFGGDTGRVYSYEKRPEFSARCRANLDWAGLGNNVELFVRDAAEGFDQTGVDALFLDMREPWECLDQAAAAMAPGAPIGFLLPTANQVSRLLEALETSPFADPEVLEIMVRRYKPLADRLRPEDRMIGHTGFLIFALKQPRLEADPDSLGTRERKQEAARREREAAREAEADAVPAPRLMPQAEDDLAEDSERPPDDATGSCCGD